MSAAAIVIQLRQLLSMWEGQYYGEIVLLYGPPGEGAGQYRICVVPVDERDAWESGVLTFESVERAREQVIELFEPGELVEMSRAEVCRLNAPRVWR
jgi:hypothetical protein